MMKKNHFLFFLIIFLAALASMLILWRLLIYKPVKEKPLAEPTPTPQPLSPNKEIGDSPEEIIRSLKEKFPLFQSLPYQAKNFSLDYTGPLHLKVKIKKGISKETAAEEVKNWLWEKGINPATHQIDFIPAL